MKMRIANEAAHCRFDVRRVFHQRSDQTEGVQAIVLPNQKAEMPAAGPRCAVAENAVANCVGDPGIRIGEQFQVMTKLGQYLV